MSAASLPDELLDLFTPRTLVALDEIVAQLDTQLKAPAVAPGCKLGLVHALLPASRLNGYPGRTSPRCAFATATSSSRTPSSGANAIRGSRSRRAAARCARSSRASKPALRRFQPRPGDDIETLIDGTANVVLRTGPAYVSGNEPMFWSRRPVLPGRLDPRSRVRLVLTQPPVRWSVENVSFAYLATALTLGRDAADRAAARMGLRRAPVATIAAARRPRCGDHSSRCARCWRATRRRSCCSIAAAPAGLVAGVLGGVGAGLRLNSAVLAESGNQIGGLLEFNVGPADEDDADARAELAELPRADPDAAFALADVEARRDTGRG